MKPALPLLILLAACDQQAEPPPVNAIDPTPVAMPAKMTAKPFAYDEKSALIEYHFGWSAEAAAVPELVARFKAEMEKQKAGLVEGAKRDKANRDKDGLDFNPYSGTTDYRTVGQSPRLLSLSAESWAYTGGAHGNGGTSALLWDREAKQEIKLTDLFAAPANRDRLLTQRWCDALNKAREEKRGEPVSGDGMFNDCPKLDDIAIIPTDKDGDHRFERLMLIASPYVAGPWVEGSYEVDLPVTPDLIAALKSEYRGSFAAPQPQ